MFFRLEKQKQKKRRKIDELKLLSFLYIWN